MIKSLLAITLILPALLASRSINPSDEQHLQALAKRAQVIVVAKVVEVDPPLGLWSGYHAVGQYVRYEAEEVIKGKLPDNKFYVAHGVVKNSKTADTEQARLSPKLFAKGNRLVLFLVSEDGKDYLTRTHPAKAYFSIDEKLLPVPNAHVLKLIREYAANE